MSRRKFTRSTSVIAFILAIMPTLVWAADGSSAAKDSTPIDRHAMVTRHNVVLTAADVQSPLSVGNGEFAFTADATGLQTFDSICPATAASSMPPP
jgi:hypothetical protein